MNYPQSLKKGDTIGICAPSDGITDRFQIERLELAINHLKKLGYHVIETQSVRRSEKGRSNSAEQRAKEFMELMENPEIKLILFASGGDFLVEMLDYLDLEKLKTLPPKWIQGYSDITGIEFIFNTILEVPSIYCDNIKSYSMEPLFENLKNALEIASGNKIVQKSFEKHEFREWREQTEVNATYQLTEKVKWRNITKEEKIEMQGRTIGGCLDCITDFFGTRYDNIENYIQKYKQDGIIWFLECFEMGTAELTRRLWQMKAAGYFKNCTGIIFGRPMILREDFGISYEEAILSVLGDLGKPIIMDADIGHVAPQLAILNGGILKITSERMGTGQIRVI